MLPSFRLIAATFLCGFIVVFAGLRLATSLNVIHESLPVMAAHAAPVSIAPVPDQDVRRGVAAVPVMYDMRFAVSRSALAPASSGVTGLIIDRAAPLELPLSILPPGDAAQEASSLAEIAPAEPTGTVAALGSDLPAADTPASAGEPPAEPEPAAPSAEAAIDGAATMKMAAVETRAAPEAPVAEPLVPEPDTASSVDAPAATSDVALPLPRPALKQAPKAAAKVVRKKRVRTAQHPAPASNAAGSFNSSPSPFGGAQQ